MTITELCNCADKVIWFIKGNCEFQLDKYEKAFEAYDNAIKLGPFYYEAIDRKEQVVEVIRERWIKNIAIIIGIIILISILILKWRK